MVYNYRKAWKTWVFFCTPSLSILSKQSLTSECDLLKSSYNLSCNGLSSQSRSWVIFGGKSVSTSCLFLLNKNGKTCLWRDSMAKTPASWSFNELLDSLLFKIGRLNFTANCFSVPKNPGMRKSKRDQSSRTSIKKYSTILICVTFYFHLFQTYCFELVCQIKSNGCSQSVVWSLCWL